MKENKLLTTTTLRLPKTLRDELALMCVLTHVSMGEFIRVSIRDKIKSLKVAK